MIGVLVNTAAVVLGSLTGMLFAGKINKKYTDALIAALALVIGVIGIQSAVKTADILCVIVCLVVGVILGEAARIDDGIEGAGDWVKNRLLRGRTADSRFTEAFVTTTILFCVGSMAVMGSIEAGVNGDNSILFAKSALDLITSVAFAAAMGTGVAFSAVSVLLFQGLIALLAAQLGGFLTPAVVNEMSAVGGVILVGMAVNMLGLRSERIRIANMLPAIFLPIAYIPIYNWIAGLIG